MTHWFLSLFLGKSRIEANYGWHFFSPRSGNTRHLQPWLTACFKAAVKEHLLYLGDHRGWDALPGVPQLMATGLGRSLWAANQSLAWFGCHHMGQPTQRSILCRAWPPGSSPPQETRTCATAASPNPT